jgi:hypothetical protein
VISKLMGTPAPLSECQFSDRFLSAALDKIEQGIDTLMLKYPGSEKPKIKSGLRGPRYFIEFPIAGKQVDAFGLILSTEKLIQAAKQTEGARITDTDSFQAGENVSYKIDFSVNSATAEGAKCKGSIVIRGIKSESGYDSFKFEL